ncbi:MAG: hypothetical protein ABIO29_06150 [Sphingomicrobium sp.]
MITTRKVRDAAIAVLLAIPTISMTRPVASEAMSPAAMQSPIMAHAAFTSMSADEKRIALPAQR